MTIDRSTLLHLELLSNASTGRTANSLIGTMDSTKTTVGSRLLRTNIMAPPTSVDTVNARLNLVDAFLEDEEFFYVVMEHLEALPDVDRMLTHMALVPRGRSDVAGGNGGGNKSGALFGNGEGRRASVRAASRGISALVCIKSTLGVIPTFARALESQLRTLDGREGRKLGGESGDGRDNCDGGSSSDEGSDSDGSTIQTDGGGDTEDGTEDDTEGVDDSTHSRSLLVGLGGGASRSAASYQSPLGRSAPPPVDTSSCGPSYWPCASQPWSRC